MTYTPIPRGTENWDVPLNNALAAMDASITSGISDALQATNNLSDLTNIPQAIDNLGISAGVVQGVNEFNVKDYGAAGNGVADDTAEIQAALDAAHAAGGGIVYLPAGTYNISSALTMYNRITLRGAGDFVTNIVQTSTSANGLVGASLIYIIIEHLRLTGPGSGTGEGIAFTVEFDYCILRDMSTTGWGSTGIDIEQPIVSNFTRVTSFNNGGSGFYIHGTGLGAGTSISMDSCWAHDNVSNGYSFFNMTYCAMVACAADNQVNSTKAGYLIDTCSSFGLIGCGSEGNNIGIKFNGGTSHTVNAFFCYATPNAGIGIYATSSVTNVHLTGIVESAPVATPTAFVQVDTGCSVTIQGAIATTANVLATGTTVVAGNSSGDRSYSNGGVRLLRNLLVGSTTALGDNGVGEVQLANATTVPTTNPTAGALLYATGGVPLTRDASGNITDFGRLAAAQTDPGPVTQGFVSWNYEPETVSATGAAVNVSGTIYLHKIYLPANKLVSNIALGVQTAGATLTAAQNLIAVYNSSGTRLGLTADQSTPWTTTGYKTAAVTSPFTTTAAGFYYVAILAVGTTPPAFYQAANAPSILFNANLAAGTFRHATGGTAQTSLPTTITMGSTASSAFNIWVAVS